jgi:hypothetical protein
MNLHPDIVRRIEESEKQGGIKLTELAVGTRVEAQTRNTLYKIAVLENGKYMVEGGFYFPEPKEAWISGSTWGGSMLKMKWLGIGMHMEFGNPECGTVTSTAVKSLKVLASDGSWEYSLND